ncbi:MAG: ATP-binding protein [Oscillospiraceae bacterium]|nr:ATP-binding protein [Oscillospiraceae bacterium]
MSIDTAFLFLTFITLLINYTTMFLTFSFRYSKTISICAPIVFSIAVHIVLYLTGTQASFYRFWGGFIHFPLFFLLSKGEALKKVFVVFFVMVCTGFQLAIASAVSGLFVPADSNEFWLLVFIIGVVFYAVYLALVRKYARRFFNLLFISGNKREWALYSLGAAFSYFAMTVAISVSSGLERIALLLFAFWSFCILCFAIINTHKKAMKTAEAEFASGIISSGRDHYQKMNEMHEQLRIMRHDYKYHMAVIDEFAANNDITGIARYLSTMREQFVENEAQDYCSNTVVNALLSHYAERCGRDGIEFRASAALPNALAIPDYELCIILGNLLENAVEACGKTLKRKFIDLQIGPLGEQLALLARNSFDGKVGTEDGKAVSAKKEGGYGLKSIEAVVARYGGELTIEWNDETFTAGVTIKL